MSFEWTDIIDQKTLDAAEAGMTDALKAGGNAALGYLEQQAINLINADKAKHEAAAQGYLTDQLATPSNPNSFGSYLSNLASSPAMQTYGPYILGGILLIVVVTVTMSRK